jgi:perosamine synthetase
MDKLAFLGGQPVIEGPLPSYCSIGQEEVEAVADVARSGCLSSFYGSWGDQFLGGPKIKGFEQAWAEKFGIKHVVSVNSATSGLIAAMGAIGLGPGDEVIVPPLTMSATVVAPLFYGAIPVFADLDPDTFCLDPTAVKQAMTPRTKAILAVNLFGHPAPLHELRALADSRGIRLVEDNAQGPLAMENGKYAGTIGHLGIFSLNYHKHVHTGEGGMCVTDDADLALRLQLIRNHGENVVEPMNIKDITNLIGFNFRMTELSAAVGIEQLKKIDKHVPRREKIARMLSEGIEGLKGLIPPKVRDGCRHVYYVWAMRFDEDAVGCRRDIFSKALLAEGFPNWEGYLRPLHLLPVFQKRIAIGPSGFPFTQSSARYEWGICPVAERLWQKDLICFETCAYDIDEARMELLVRAVHKVYAHRRELATQRTPL